MGAGQSDLYKNTYGDRPGNIPDEAINGNISEWLSKTYEEEKYYRYDFTDAQKSSINRIANTIKHNLKESDFTGTKLDLENTPVPNGKGGYFNHLKEMKQSYVALQKSVKSLEGTLRNPFLTQDKKDIITNVISTANAYIERIENLFNQYGQGGLK